MNFIVGQRWISHSETQLGLGIVTETGHRKVKFIFPAAGESRIYAADTAPLSRITYNIGETIADNNDHTYQVTGLHVNDGLITYSVTDEHGNNQNIHEMDLNSYVQFTSPQQRLFNGQLDKNQNYNLRIETLLHLDRLQNSSVRGLQGSRTDLIPHQVYIANNVARRHAPRVLLADEVGLGKTIEAGMILHYQVHTGITHRVLIIVPDSLVHQWLVEMLRRFNLSFSVFDQERFDALYADNQSNPFESEQMIICPLSLISHVRIIQESAIAAFWNMVIVDEAHHLEWHENESSVEYKSIEALATRCESLLLLTATPEQLGLDSHFARLRLLDPARFHSFEAFKNEQSQYQKLNSLVQSLIHQDKLSQQQNIDLKHYLGDDIYNDTVEEIITKLLDHHGTSRVLFRNTRSAIQGFPKRLVIPVALNAPESYQFDSLNIYPEINQQATQWLAHDPRVIWLIDTLKEHKPEKFLLVCHHADTAIALDNYLNLQVGIRSASFYEGLTIVERDRAAAYFAEGSNPDEIESGIGAQVLVCSEIGSEGRNFQFAHHLILFDLPMNPDLIEQRIGRLDRIGQLHDIKIHIPYIKNTAQEILFRWLHEGVKIFSTSNSAGYEIYRHFSSRLDNAINKDSKLDALIKDTADYSQLLLKRLNQGRDRLLELNSFDRKTANQLIEQIKNEEHKIMLTDYMEQVFDQFGVDSEFHSEDSYIIRPGSHYHGDLSGIKEEGSTITYNRQKALSREDMEFINWEHPMVSDSMEMILNSEFGNASSVVTSINGLQKGTLLVETWFSLNVIADKKLQLERYLPIQPIRFLLDNNKNNHSGNINYKSLNAHSTSLPQTTALKIIEKTRPIIESLLSQSEILADQKLKEIKQLALEKMQASLGNELMRLKALKKYNSSIRQDEIDFIKDSIKQSGEYIERVKYKLQAIRIAVNN